MAVAALFVPSIIPSWHQDLGDAWGTVTPVAIPVVAIVSLGVRQVFRSNHELAEARVELARLAAENERIRIARDLHDLLGHSLTTITVKADLARQLGEPIPRGPSKRSPRSRTWRDGRSPTCEPPSPTTAT